MLKGKRKFLICMGYMVGCFGICVLAILYGRDLMGTAAMCTAIAPGVGVVIYGNIREHEAANGKP